MGTESSWTKIKLLIETLTKESLTVALKETEFEKQDEPDQHLNFG